MSDPEKLLSSAVDAWKTTVSVQQHFNDLELRVRNFAITFMTAVLGLVGLALKEEPDSLLPWALLLIGIVGWLAFYMMDRWWYHRFLEGAGEHAGVAEVWLAAATGTGTHLFNLSETIKQKSGISIGKHKIRSKHRIDLFYAAVAVAAAVLAVVFYWHSGPPKESKPTEVVLSAAPGAIPISLPPGVWCSCPPSAPPPTEPTSPATQPPRSKRHPAATTKSPR
ncbi:MAG TPA: hypothetical protein VMU15_11945 [Anaeromyxobacter sp.]|nr:hypothetical protein [Anaeromyxobacter sp.]